MRTLILSCSATKRPDAGLLPALDRYDGPAYRTLRANRAAAGELRVLVLSAEFGLIDATKPIADYDRRMTLDRALELAPSVGAELRRLSDCGELVGDVFVYGGADYRNCAQLALINARLDYNRRASVGFSHGGIGEQLGQLKAFLREGGR